MFIRHSRILDTGRNEEKHYFQPLKPPAPEKRPHSDTRHGITRVDEFPWLRAENWQEVFRDPPLLDPAIRAHLEAENAYQQALMADTAELRKRSSRR